MNAAAQLARPTSGLWLCWGECHSDEPERALALSSWSLSDVDPRLRDDRGQLTTPTHTLERPLLSLPSARVRQSGR